MGEVKFNYKEAFLRNIGIVTEAEQEKISKVTVAIAGMGGVGSSYALNFARLGVCRFVISDPDTYSVSNLNRQYSATMDTIGKNKAEVTKNIILSINPTAEVKIIPGGIRKENIDEFLEKADIFIDGFDFFEVDIRLETFMTARKKGIYSLTAAPFGFSSTLLVFSPTGMSFVEYFNIKPGMEKMEKLASFAVGLAPAALHFKYMDLKKVSLSNRSGPCIAPTYGLTTSLIVTESLAILLNKRKSKCIPHYYQYDPFLQKQKYGYLIGGNKNPVQKLKLKYLLWKLAKEQEKK
ncbi:MAG: hypothetical protein A2452_03615 [Candidatus Firestonebacteria bacterium RIFOXYC2_FULL_39_67]|nr:MAG: hypothetical protein A2536_00440 [Candidatus Firestonebacteria bacterium RIFOXYD2_FULL_39_29]OGF51937.1 MAG: hypothetical protein A2497_07645 [Candidatus Firestonebacteria bacterium RifOxyC12_full_39_7]OGF57091.1 MAG: hypothetical protein A2452_03615 [Candidatus Firestonebacteria bacterium RIFOXYC2_FULL_39_67]